MQRELQDCKSDQDGAASPVFPPEYENAVSAREALLHLIRRDPRVLGHERSRWTLGLIRQSCPWLNLNSAGGLSQLLERLGISYKRGREYIHSPDPDYEAKLALIEHCLAQARQEPDRYVFLYQDEMTYYRQPLVAHAYEAKGRCCPLARRSYRSNTRFRGIGALNAITGQVTYHQAARAGIPHLSNFYAAVRAEYPLADTIYIAQDNWPIHFHPDVLARLQPQEYPWPFHIPATWPTQPGRRAVHDDLPILLLPLPTYASWLNPIEKLWRWLKQDLLYLHRLSDDWQTLKQLTTDFMAQFQDGSPELLTFVGLLSV